MRALHAFQAQHGALPKPWDRADAAALIALAQKINGEAKFKVDRVDERLLTQLAFTSRGALVGISAFFGGLVAQEILKAVSGKFTPLRQWV